MVGRHLARIRLWTCVKGEELSSGILINTRFLWFLITSEHSRVGLHFKIWITYSSFTFLAAKPTNWSWRPWTTNVSLLVRPKSISICWSWLTSFTATDRFGLSIPDAKLGLIFGYILGQLHFQFEKAALMGAETGDGSLCAYCSSSSFCTTISDLRDTVGTTQPCARLSKPQILGISKTCAVLVDSHPAVVALYTTFLGPGGHINGFWLPYCNRWTWNEANDKRNL